MNKDDDLSLLRNWLATALVDVTDSELTLIEQIHCTFNTNNTVELSYKDFNVLHDKTKQKLLGITYTPNTIRVELTKTVLDEVVKNKDIRDLKICDPCCGSGLFSITLIQELQNRGVDLIHALNEIIYFSDVDRVSVVVSIANIFSYLKRINADVNKVKLNASVNDFFILNKKFDAFITNPPYVKLQNLDDGNRLRLKEKYPSLFVGSMGLSTFFMKKMFDDLNDFGMLGIITQNNFFTSNSAKPLRKEIQDYLYKIDTFGSEAIFDDVIAYTCLMYLAKSKQKNFKFRKINSNLGFKQRSSIISTHSLDASKWRLGTKEELEDLKSLENNGTPLGKACRIWVGIATQFDKGFTVFNENGV